MGLILAFKAFIKAYKEPKKAEQFLEEHPKKIAQKQEDFAHLRLLALMQQSGRLIDFLKEDIAKFNDAQVGAAVRRIHQECKKSLEDYVTVRPIMEENEGSQITIPEGYDPSRIKLVGNVKGTAPFTGKLIHKGWKAHKHSLPKQQGLQANEIIHPAEVEIK